MFGGIRKWAGALVAAAVIGAAAYGATTATSRDDEAAPLPIRNTPTTIGDLRLIPPGGRLVVRGVDTRASRADGAVYELSADDGAKRVGRLSCKRVAVTFTGNGLCFRVAVDGNSYEAVAFDEEYQPFDRFPIDGIPDRARFSPSGLYAAYTSFDPAGAQGYFETPTAYSTYTRIIEPSNGRTVLRLEDLKVTRGGRKLDTRDADFWGVTFIDDETFYATVAVRKQHYLLMGSIHAARAKAIRDHVECPALSPDGTRIAYKKRIDGTNTWRLHVLDLRNGADMPLAEQRSIDDQPEWIGDHTIVYSDDWATFVVPADGSGSPHRLARLATSPGYVIE